MIYIFGFFGFVMGFGVGLGTINVLLRHHTQEQIQSNKSFKWTYGLAVWLFAVFGSWLGVGIYHNYYI